MWTVIVWGAILFGFIRGLMNTKPSFWRGVGEGLASKDNGSVKTSFYMVDRKTGVGMRISDK